MKTKLGLLASISLAALALVGCGDDGGSSGNGPSGEAVIANKTITGVSQKGPFVNGSSVTVQELDGKTLAQTGKSFKGKISGDKGEFTVSNVSLASQYALLEANGYYLNENTGAKSNGPIALNALVDLSKRENVNVNLLTHLEYERALHLLSTSKGVAAAKKQAEDEIFKAFGVTGDFANSEELDILAKGEGDAALLAISVLMQGDLTEAALSERLANFADDIEQDGTWDDAATKAQMADWASSTANLAAIRDTVERWNTGSKAPAFEQVVKEFWWNEYGLGACAVSNDGEIKQNVNSRSANHDVYYICDTGDWYIKLTMTDSRDGTIYKTTRIGTQMWMAENLNYATVGSRCYNDNAEYCTQYGRLYSWAAAMDSATTGCGYGSFCAASSGKVQGVCPNGWHLPDSTEWEMLFTTAGGKDSAGTKLKSAMGWSPNGSDAYGFSALPSGSWGFGGETEGLFGGIGSEANFWSSSESFSDRAYEVWMNSTSAAAYIENAATHAVGGSYKHNCFSVRCVKD